MSESIHPDELSRLRSLEALVGKLDSNPKTHKALLKLVKEAMPEAMIPELDAAAPLEEAVAAAKAEAAEQIKALQTELDAFRTEHRGEKTSRSIERERQKLRDLGWDADGIKQIETAMTERGIVDYDVAAAYVEKAMPQSEPSRATYQGRDWNIASPDKGDEDHNLLMTNPVAYKNKMVNQTMNELSAGKGFRRMGSQNGPTGSWG
jgi:hypothetical protein